MIKKSVALKILAGVLIVAIIVGLAFAVFKSTNKSNNSTVATNTLEVQNSSNQKDFNKSITNKYNQTPEFGYIQTYANSLQSSNQSLYNKFRLEHLQYIVQSTLISNLANDSAFASNDKNLAKANDIISNYSIKLASTLSAIKIFNQDYQISTTSENAKQGELERILNLLNEQNKALIDANSLLLQNMIEFNYQSKNVALGDLYAVLHDVLYKQSKTLQTQINNVYKNLSLEYCGVVFDDTTKILKSFVCAQNNSFVYATLNTISSTSCEQFVELASKTSQFDNWLETLNKTEFLNSVSDSATYKQSLLKLVDFLNKLSQEVL